MSVSLGYAMFPAVLVLALLLLRFGLYRHLVAVNHIFALESRRLAA